MNSFTFDEQYHNFVKYGFAIDPDINNQRIIIANQKDGKEGASNSNLEANVASLDDPRFIAKSVYGLESKEEKQKKKELKKKRKKFGDSSTGDFLGPWASYEGLYCSKNILI